MRVLTVVNSLDVGGGIETFLARFFQRVDRTGLELEVCCTDRPGGLAPDVEKLGIPIWPFRYQLNPFATVQAFRKELDRRGDYHVVHSHLGNFSGPLLRAARRSGVRERLAHYHNLSSGHVNDWKRRLYEHWMGRWVLREATRIIGTSWGSLQAWYPNVWERDPRMGVIRCGIPIEVFAAAADRAGVRSELGVAADAPLIGHVGRFAWQKNHATLIDALKIVADRRVDVRLLLIGDGPLRAEIEARAKQLGLFQHVIFAGTRRDVPRLLSALDVFALPSVAEGFGLAAAEAQAAGVPVVASNLSSVREAVAPEFQKYLRDPRDVAGVADALLVLLDRVKADGSLRDAARRYGCQFSIERSCAAMLANWRVPGAVAPPDPAPWAAPRSPA